MQAQVHEIRADILRLRPPASGFGNDQRNPMSAKQFHERRLHETGMSKLQGVTQLSLGIDRQTYTPLHPARSLSRQG